MVKSVKRIVSDAYEMEETAHSYWLLEDWPRATTEATLSMANSLLAMMEMQNEMLQIARRSAGGE